MTNHLFALWPAMGAVLLVLSHIAVYHAGKARYDEQLGTTDPRPGSVAQSMLDAARSAGYDDGYRTGATNYERVWAAGLGYQNRANLAESNAALAFSQRDQLQRVVDQLTAELHRFHLDTIPTDTYTAATWAPGDNPLALVGLDTDPPAVAITEAPMLTQTPGMIDGRRVEPCDDPTCSICGGTGLVRADEPPAVDVQLEAIRSERDELVREMGVLDQQLAITRAERDDALLRIEDVNTRLVAALQRALAAEAQVADHEAAVTVPAPADGESPEAHAQAVSDAYSRGMTAGYSSGRVAHYDEGHADGHALGLAQGRTAGFAEASANAARTVAALRNRNADLAPIPPPPAPAEPVAVLPPPAPADVVAGLLPHELVAIAASDTVTPLVTAAQAELARREVVAP